MADIFRFGGFELDLMAYALRRGDVRVKLEKVPMDMLILLVRKAGTLVGRDEIGAVLWKPDVFLERDAAINTAIRKVRRALGDVVEQPQFVETVVGKGYRFIAPVEPRTARPGSSSARWRPAFSSCVLTRGKREYTLDTGENVIGRDPAAQVYVNHASISRRHARISISAHQAVLEDLDSRNGTFVDGRRVEGPLEIRDGAIIGLGPITLTFVVVSAPRTTAPLSTSEFAQGAKE
jgi:DNA-binding winged helix-turn-helix (wHTH) protein